jgi:DME family drug/metabolite transporter
MVRGLDDHDNTSFSGNNTMITGYLFILAAASCWGLIGIFSNLAFSQGIQPIEVAFWRACLAWICFAVQAFVQKETHLDRKDIPLLLVFSVFGIALFYISYLYAVKSGGAALASVLLYTAPAWVILVAFFVYKEKLTWIKLLAVVLVILGVFFISTTGGNVSADTSIGILAILAGLTSGFCYSLYYTMGKYFSKKYTSANLFFYVLPMGALCLFPFVEFGEKNTAAWAALIAVAVISTFIANYCYYQGLKKLEAGRASIVATLEPVVASVTAYVFLGEYFTPLGYLGSVFIVAAVVAIIYKE